MNADLGINMRSWNVLPRTIWNRHNNRRLGSKIGRVLESNKPQELVHSGLLFSNDKQTNMCIFNSLSTLDQRISSFDLSSAG